MENERNTAIQTYEFHASSNINCVDIGQRSFQVLATGNNDRKVNLFTVKSSEPAMSLSGLSSTVHSVKFGVNEETIAAGSLGGAIKVWDLKALKILITLSGHKGTATCLDRSGYNYLASGSMDNSVKVWDLRKKGCCFTYTGHSKSVNSVQFSPDGKWLVSSSKDGTAKLWDLIAGQVLHEFECPRAEINQAIFHPFEFLLATCSSDKKIRFWDLERFAIVGESDQETAGVNKILFHDGGQCLYSLSHDNCRVHAWEPYECYGDVPLPSDPRFKLLGLGFMGKKHSPELTLAAVDQSKLALFCHDVMNYPPFARRTVPSAAQSPGTTVCPGTTPDPGFLSREKREKSRRSFVDGRKCSMESLQLKIHVSPDQDVSVAEQMATSPDVPDTMEGYFVSPSNLSDEPSDVFRPSHSLSRSPKTNRAKPSQPPTNSQPPLELPGSVPMRQPSSSVAVSQRLAVIPFDRRTGTRQPVAQPVGASSSGTLPRHQTTGDVTISRQIASGDAGCTSFGSGLTDDSLVTTMSLSNVFNNYNSPAGDNIDNSRQSGVGGNCNNETTDFLASLARAKPKSTSTPFHQPPAAPAFGGIRLASDSYTSIIQSGTTVGCTSVTSSSNTTNFETLSTLRERAMLNDKNNSLAGSGGFPSRSPNAMDMAVTGPVLFDKVTSYDSEQHRNRAMADISEDDCLTYRMEYDEKGKLRNYEGGVTVSPNKSGAVYGYVNNNNYSNNNNINPSIVLSASNGQVAVPYGSGSAGLIGTVNPMQHQQQRSMGHNPANDVPGPDNSDGRTTPTGDPVFVSNPVPSIPPAEAFPVNYAKAPPLPISQALKGIRGTSSSNVDHGPNSLGDSGPGGSFRSQISGRPLSNNSATTGRTYSKSVAAVVPRRVQRSAETQTFTGGGPSGGAPPGRAGASDAMITAAHSAASISVLYPGAFPPASSGAFGHAYSTGSMTASVYPPSSIEMINDPFGRLQAQAQPSGLRDQFGPRIQMAYGRSNSGVSSMVHDDAYGPAAGYGAVPGHFSFNPQEGDQAEDLDPMDFLAAPDILDVHNPALLLSGPTGTRPVNGSQSSATNGVAFPQQQTVEGDVLGEISDKGDAVDGVLQQRVDRLRTARDLVRNRGAKTSIEYVTQINDTSLLIDLLNIFNYKRNLWSLDSVVLLLPKLKILLQSKQEGYSQIACTSLRLILRDFGTVIKNGLQQVPCIGVDISHEERARKSKRCMTELNSIRTILDKKNKECTRGTSNPWKEVCIMLQMFDE